MKPIIFFLVTGFIISFCTKEIHAQHSPGTAKPLSIKHQHIITISAFTTKGDHTQLQKALDESLNAGLTINEIKEVLVHLSAYTGFPRSLQGINTFMKVLDIRKGKGHEDTIGRDSTPAETGNDKYELGKKVLEKLTGMPENMPKTGYAAFVPVIDTFLKEHLFADIFGRDIITYSDREMATLSALVSLGGVEPMMQGHMRIAMNIGITTNELNQMLLLLEKNIGKEKTDAGRRVLSAMSNQNSKQNDTAISSDTNLNKKGEKAPSTNFTGTAWVNMLVQANEGLNCSIGVVQFEPGARTYWHRHPGGQVLLVTEGMGYYQERGQAKRVIQKGDVIKCLPGKDHWHGASPGSKLIHTAIGPGIEKGKVVWLKSVTDEEYNSN